MPQNTDDLFNTFNTCNTPQPPAHKGRGTGENPPSRFTAWTRHKNHDDWAPEVEKAPATEVLLDTAKQILTYNTSPDLPFDRSINPYRGCEHGCIYCYARPSHAFLDHSPGLDFETKLYQKPHAAQLLRRELSRPNYQCRPILLGSNTDAWQPIERVLHSSRAVLTVLHEFQHPVHIITKAALIERELDLLIALAEKNLVQVSISLSTLDPELARHLEPRASAPQARLTAIKRLSSVGIPTRVMVAPVIPGLSDHELETVLVSARQAGASAANYALLRLPQEIRPLFENWLSHHAPEKAARIMAILYDMRGNQGNDPRFHHRMRGLGHFADLLAQRFALHVRRLGFSELPPLNHHDFSIPNKPHRAHQQLDLFSI